MYKGFKTLRLFSTESSSFGISSEIKPSKEKPIIDYLKLNKRTTLKEVVTSNQSDCDKKKYENNVSPMIT